MHNIYRMSDLFYALHRMDDFCQTAKIRKVKEKFINDDYWNLH